MIEPNRKYGKVTVEQLHKLVQMLVDIDKQKVELPEVVGKCLADKKQKIFGNNFHWSYLYKYSYKFTLFVYLCVSGMLSVIYKVAKRKPQDIYPEVIQELDKMEEFKGGPFGLFKERHFLKFFYPVSKSIEAIMFYATTMNRLLVKAKYDDEALFKAVRIDRSVISYPGIAERIARAEMESDETFFKGLGASLKAKKGKAIEYGYLRIILAALKEAGALEQMSMNEAYELLAVELKLYPKTGESPERSLWQFISRWKDEVDIYMKK